MAYRFFRKVWITAKTFADLAFGISALIFLTILASPYLLYSYLNDLLDPR